MAKLNAALVLASVISATALFLVAQDVGADNKRFVVILREARSDVSPSGINIHSCAVMFQDGRFHLERRIQQLPRSSADLKVFESWLTTAQLRSLQELLDSESLKVLPAFEKPSTAGLPNGFRAFQATIARGEHIQTVGYVASLKEPTKDLTGSTGTIDKGWHLSRTSLQPLQQWFHDLEASSLQPSNAQSTLCAADAVADPEKK